jgi:hypothetical protein
MTQRSNRAGLRALVGMLALVAGTVAVEDARAAPSWSTA